MDVPAFEFYELCNTVTGTVLYCTCASATEILQANARLRTFGFTSRYYLAGTFKAPCLHDPLRVATSRRIMALQAHQFP